MLIPEYHNGAIFPVMHPGEQVDFRLIRVLRHRSAVHKPVEKLSHGFRRAAAKDEDSVGIFIKMEELGFLDVGEIFQSIDIAGRQQSVHPVLERHQSLRTSLEMLMVRR